MSELHQMQDEEEVADLLDDAIYARVRGRSTAELGASKNFHVDCPCCGYRTEYDFTEAQQSKIDKGEQTLKRKVRDRIQYYFTNSWHWKTHERQQAGPNRSKCVRSDSIDMVWQTGTGHTLRWLYRMSKKRGLKNWFAILWHNAPVIGEMFFACKLGSLFDVLKGIADDSPEFALRLRQVADNALKRDGSASHADLGDDGPAGRRESGVDRGFDPDSAFTV